MSLRSLKEECGTITYVCYMSNLKKNLTWNQIWPATKSKHQLYSVQVIEKSCNKFKCMYSVYIYLFSSTKTGVVPVDMKFTYSSMSATLISITTQPFQGSFDFKFNIISSKCPPGVCQSSHCFRSHLHHNLVIWWKQVPQIIGKPAHFGCVSTINSNKGN